MNHSAEGDMGYDTDTGNQWEKREQTLWENSPQRKDENIKQR